jgi:hypothetical protein
MKFKYGSRRVPQAVPLSELEMSPSKPVFLKMVTDIGSRHGLGLIFPAFHMDPSMMMRAWNQDCKSLSYRKNKN